METRPLYLPGRGWIEAAVFSLCPPPLPSLRQPPHTALPVWRPLWEKRVDPHRRGGGGGDFVQQRQNKQYTPKAEEDHHLRRGTYTS